MRFHQSESAFFVFIAVILAAGVTTYFAYDELGSIGHSLHEPGPSDSVAI